ncbi:LysR family transcriptional regulator [Crenobacter sp. SG2303]|uniref:LysR family transcriptional regulator n=1 Tax=Crenobacter oryzisoli TaxID=3056844 RepID=A0ABT7XV01_9NEIS|nr:LysR family transcriptional regulator [Crenobacter sp. SG2303]MDN0077625.1 LysR family transcriptional regulator [Crenobacter sp. SG2303]
MQRDQGSRPLGTLNQPAVSGMLNRLRESFGDPLFVRSQRGIVPTLRAQALAVPVKKVLAEVEAMLRPADFDPASSTLTLRVAATDYALRTIVLPFISLLRTVAPGIRVAVRPIEDTHASLLLERGEIDLALMTLESALPDLHARRLFDEDYVCVLRLEHPDARRGRMPLNRFCALDHALVSLSGDAFSGANNCYLKFAHSCL